MRADSDRELAAATQRRDTINAQLSNVRQMLATLTGGAMVPMVDPFEGDDATPADADADRPSGGRRRGRGGRRRGPHRGQDEDKS